MHIKGTTCSGPTQVLQTSLLLNPNCKGPLHLGCSVSTVLAPLTMLATLHLKNGGLVSWCHHIIENESSGLHNQKWIGSMHPWVECVVSVVMKKPCTKKTTISTPLFQTTVKKSPTGGKKFQSYKKQKIAQTVECTLSLLPSPYFSTRSCKYLSCCNPSPQWRSVLGIDTLFYAIN